MSRLILTGLVFAGLAAYLLPRIAMQIPAQLASSAWPTAMATVTQSETYPRRVFNRRLRFRYSFDVQGKRYEPSRRRLVELSGYYLFESPTKFAAAHPVGSRITVWYDPADPDQATIAPGLSAWDVVLPVVFLASFAIGGARIFSEVGGRITGQSARRTDSDA